MSDTSIWYVYLVRCADTSLYCGVTTDVSRRLAQHNGKLSGGARYTRTRRPVELLTARPCAGRSEALRLEYAVKQRPQAQKLAFLQESSRAAKRILEGPEGNIDVTRSGQS